METVEYAVLFSSLVIWDICLCVRVPKNILGTNNCSPFSFFFVLPVSLAVSFPESQEHSVQGPEDCKNKINKFKEKIKSHCKMNLLNLHRACLENAL